MRLVREPLVSQFVRPLGVDIERQGLDSEVFKLGFIRDLESINFELQETNIPLHATVKMRFSIFTLASFIALTVSVSAGPTKPVETFCMYCPNNCTYECPINARCVCPGVLEGYDSCPSKCPFHSRALDGLLTDIATLTKKIAKKCYTCKKCPFGPRILCANNGEPCECPEMASKWFPSSSAREQEANTILLQSRS